MSAASHRVAPASLTSPKGVVASGIDSGRRPRPASFCCRSPLSAPTGALFRRDCTPWSSPNTLRKRRSAPLTRPSALRSRSTLQPTPISTPPSSTLRLVAAGFATCPMCPGTFATQTAPSQSIPFRSHLKLTLIVFSRCSRYV